MIKHICIFSVSQSLCNIYNIYIHVFMNNIHHTGFEAMVTKLLDRDVTGENKKLNCYSLTVLL